jgi:hypothetical protein
MWSIWWLAVAVQVDKVVPLLAVAVAAQVGLELEPNFR